MSTDTEKFTNGRAAMSVGKALKYPFRNPARLLFLALAQSLLIFTLPVVSHYLARFHGTDSFTVSINLAIFVIFVLDVIWLHGYSVAVIRNVLNGEDAPPRLQLGRNLREGCWLVLATLAYAVPIFVIFGLAVHVNNTAFQSYLRYGGGFNYELASTIFVAGLVLHFSLKFLARIVYDIGVARYAANGYRDSLFEMRDNASILWRNLSTTLSHEFRQAILLGLFALLAFVVTTVGTEVYPAPDADIFDDLVAFNWTAVAALVLTLGYLLYWHASTHLLAHYALTVGIGRHGEAQNLFRKSS